MNRPTASARLKALFQSRPLIARKVPIYRLKGQLDAPPARWPDAIAATSRG
jgi:hypothetical protein